MTLFNEKIRELEEIKNTEDSYFGNSYYKKEEDYKRVIKELCDYYVDGSIAGNYFSERVAEDLSKSLFNGFSIVESEDEFYALSDLGEEIIFTEYKEMSSITYRTADGMKDYKIYRSRNHAFVREEDYSKTEDSIVSGELRVYNLNREPIFERSKKFIIRNIDDKKTIIVEKYSYKNDKLKKSICSTTTMGETTMETKFDKVVDESKYRIKDGELFVINENDSQVMEKNNNLLIRLLKL